MKYVHIYEQSYDSMRIFSKLSKSLHYTSFMLTFSLYEAQNLVIVMKILDSHSNVNYTK